MASRATAFTHLVLDAKGDLWARTESGGITRRYQGKFQSYSGGSDDLRGKSVRRFLLNNEGNLVVFTDDRIVHWNGERFMPSLPVAGEKDDSIVLWSKSGAFWYANGQTLYRFKDNRTSEYRVPGAAGASYIIKLFEDSRGRVWIGTVKSGLFVLENEKFTAYDERVRISGTYVSPHIEDREGNVWAATNDGAVIISRDGVINRVTTAEGLSDNNIASIYASNSIYEDREGNIWIGTLYGGLNRVSRQSVRFYSKKDGLQADVVNPIYEAGDGGIWIGGNNLTEYSNGRFNAVAAWKKLAQQVTAIEQDRDGNFWFGNFGNVYYYKDGKITAWTDKFGLRPDITDIHQDRQGDLWFASSVGLFRQRNGAMTRYTKNEGLASDDVKIIHEATDGTLWIGTYGGLSRFKDNAFTSFTANDGLASNQVRSIYEDAENVLWIGSYDGGLTRFKDGKFTRYTSNDGLFNDGVFQILEDEHGSLWISCNRGIYRVPKQQLNDFADGKISRIESFALGKADGLLETECNGGQQPAGIKTRAGKLWFPTQGGVAVIDPNEIRRNPFAPPVVIESALIDGEMVGLNDEIEIAPGKNNLEIAYTGLSLIKPEFVKFRYKLEGQDADWIEAGTRRTAYYSHIPPGKYTFTVIAANSDGVWNKEGARVHVRVTPPFYRTWWFSLLALMLVLGTPFILYRRRVARLERAAKAQEEFSRKLLVSQEHERQRIAAELHDSIGQSLLIIKNRAFLALSDLDEPETVREQLEELSESATGAIEECREISYNLRPYQINRFGLTKTLEAIFRRISEVTETKTTIDLDSVDDLFSAESQTNIYRVVQETVNNIIKHSHATEARFIIKRRGDEVEMIIQDDGRGFDKSLPDRNGNGRGGFGLIGMTERVRMLGGVYEIESQPGSGTIIKIKLTLSPSNERS